VLHEAASRLALSALSCVDGIPQLLASEKLFLVRTWIDGVPMQEAKALDAPYFAAALQLVGRLHALLVAQR
jgi:hypothetical protein